MTSVLQGGQAQSRQEYPLNFVSAHHEAAHSVVAVLLADRNKRFALYDTVVFLNASSDQSSGETRFYPKRKQELLPRENIESLLCMIITLMAGRAAEEILFNESDCCSADYALACKYARDLECYANDYNFVFCFEDLIKDLIGEESNISIYQGIQSDEIVNRCLDVSRQFLTHHTKLLERLATVLLNGKRLRAQEVKNILAL